MQQRGHLDDINRYLAAPGSLVAAACTPGVGALAVSSR